MDRVSVYLDRSFFSAKKRIIAEYGNLKATTFLYDSGVHGLLIENEKGYLITLPYQGQQIWDCSFLGRNLTMKSMFSEPVPTTEYLKSYGAFLIHCGVSAIGNPSEHDNHPLHGELPNAKYENVYIQFGEDEKGKFMTLGGKYHHCIAFERNYIAEPQIKVYENTSIIDVSMSIENIKKTDMELMYMMHINFRPIDNSELIYTADYNPDKVMVYAEMSAPEESNTEALKLYNYINRLIKNPELHHILDPELPYDPEIVFIIQYNEDENGDAHTIQLHTDGYASYVSHKPSQLKYGVRWIARTKDEDAIGIVLPSTAGHRGYTREKELGNVEILPAGKKVTYNVKLGILNPEEAKNMKNKIEMLNS
ncbi:MAG: DUF4432 family protein [Caldicoprobacterales bacterium]